MNHPALTPHRSVIFDPAATDNLRALDAAPVSSAVIGLRAEPTAHPAKNLIIGPINDSFAALRAVNAVFDVIVSAPTPGATIPTKGLPKPNIVTNEVAKPAVRRLVFDNVGPDAAAVATMDLGYATFLMANALLSSFGEAMLIVGPESLSLVEKDAWYSRVWNRSPEPTGNLTKLFIARDHKPLPGDMPGVDVGRHRIRGQTLSALTQSPTSLQKFRIVQEELRKRAAAVPDYDVLLLNNRVYANRSQFLFNSNQAYRDACIALDPFCNKGLMDIAVMRDERDRFNEVLKTPVLRVAPALVEAFKDVCRQMATQTAPFTRPTPVQRVAWLDEQTGIECATDFGQFRAGKHYPIRTKVVTGKRLEHRHRPGHTLPEEVFVTGQEVLVEIDCHPKGEINVTHYGTHVFSQFPITEDMEEHEHYQVNRRHTLSELIQHFKMPDVQDIAEADPATYLKYVNRLKKLETVTA